MLPRILEPQLKTLSDVLPRLSEPQRLKAIAEIERVAWTAEHEALRFFEPHGGQLEFLKLLDGGFICVSGAGNGWGKSEILAAIFAATMWPELAPPGLDIPALKNWGNKPKRGRIYSMPAELDDIGSLQTAIRRLFPTGRYESEKGRYSYPSKFSTDTGWEIDLFSYERDSAEAAGPNIGLQGFNEPPPEPLFKEAVARARAGGYIICGFTSLLDNIWVVDGLLNKHDGKDIRVRFGSSCENCKQHGINGNLEHAQIQRILDQYDQDEREARFTGRPLTLSGRIFKLFDRSVHVASEEFDPPAQGATIGMSCDPAIGKPCAMLWRYIDASGVLHYYDEWPNFPFEGAKDSNLTVSDYANIIRSKEAGRSCESRILDRHFGQIRRSMGGKTLKEEFSDAGIDFRDSYVMGEEVETGIAKVKEMLRWDKERPQDAINRPRIRISPRCKNLIAAIERWGRDPKTGKPLESYKDFIDCLRYDVMSNPSLVEPRYWDVQGGGHYGVGN